MLVREIAEIHGKKIGDINRRINDNRKRFINGVDIIDLKNDASNASLEEMGFSSRDLAISNNIYILSERGYAKLLKILEDDKAWELYDELVDNYFQMRSQQPKTKAEMFALASQAMLEQERRLSQVESRLEETEKKQENISEILALNPTEWRKKINTILNKIANSIGGGQAFQDVRKESYKRLEARGNYKLSVRLTNKKGKMALEGVAKSKIDKVNYMDVIADDARLTEIYLSVVKEMAIHYSVQLEGV
ncbi:ORF6N domain-containing protein [Bacillus mesophilum]|uniref:ORF6N domain-containing protein n=2 Tax=Bacillus mesophilum TaxID=1071718 RepID=A0A7V7RP46_9BACI|nr:ORF6N domain-containing protein [Bacillus mesophilum]